MKETSMELHQVRYFVALANSMNFTRAAEQCNVTQPALTKAIQKLEYELGGPLVFRERQLTQLTDLGKLMLPILEQTLSGVEAARTNAKEFKRRKVATLRVALTPSISSSILMKPLAELTRQLPGLQVDLVEAESSNIFDNLLSGEVGVALGSSCIGNTPERIDRWGLFDEQVFVACAEDGRLAENAEVSMKDLRAAQWLEPIDCEVARSFREIHLSDGKSKQTRHRGQGLQYLVSADLGVMLAPQHAPVALGTVVRPIADVEFTRAVELFVVAGRQYSPALDAFVKTCRLFDWKAQFASEPGPHVVAKSIPFEDITGHPRRGPAQRLSA
jgi:LysR family transcriptional regulator, hydrogen peroxide-inducible genes activator